MLCATEKVNLWHAFVVCEYDRSMNLKLTTAVIRPTLVYAPLNVTHFSMLIVSIMGHTILFITDGKFSYLVSIIPYRYVCPHFQPLTWTNIARIGGQQRLCLM